MNIEAIHSESDPEKLRDAALDLHRQNLLLGTRNSVLENENTVLLGRITALVEQLAKATDRDVQLSLGLEIKKLNEMLAEKNKELFGSSKSERRDPPEPKPEPAEKKKHPGHGPTKQLKLPIEEVLHTRPDPVAPCPSCAQPQPIMAGQTEDTEQITIIERKVVLCVHKRQKYRCTLCGRIDAAPGAPEPLLPGGRYTPEFAVAVAVDKYDDHLPLDRQVHRFERQGLVVTTATLWDQLVALYTLLLPVYLAVHAYLLQKTVLGADESPWRVMGKGRSAKWWTWVLVGEDAVYYRLAPTRGSAAATELLRGYKGILSVDGYSVYTSLEARGTQLSLVEALEAETCRFTVVACWMHARRGFIKADDAGHATAKEAVALIARLYRVEDKVDAVAKQTGEAVIEVRRRLRNTESRAIVEELRTWIDMQTPIPSLKLEKALGYAKNQWPRLIRFLDDPNAPIDNGWAERAVRGTVLGRKNHYGSHSELGTRVAALFYTICETCKLIDVDPAAYMLAAALRAKANREDVLTPHVWKAERDVGRRPSDG